MWNVLREGCYTFVSGTTCNTSQPRLFFWQCTRISSSKQNKSYDATKWLLVLTRFLHLPSPKLTTFWDPTPKTWATWWASAKNIQEGFTIEGLQLLPIERLKGSLDVHKGMTIGITRTTITQTSWSGLWSGDRIVKTISTTKGPITCKPRRVLIIQLH